MGNDLEIWIMNNAVDNGPDWVLLIVFVLLAGISIVMLAGHGENLIAGYNTAGEDEKNRYDTKKLCRVVGAGMAVIAIMLLIMILSETRLPAHFITVFNLVTLADCLLVIVLANTICRK